MSRLYPQRSQFGFPCADRGPSGGDPDRAYRRRGSLAGGAKSLADQDQRIYRPDPGDPEHLGKSGHRRYPVWYTTLEELDIDLDGLLPFRPMPPHGGVSGMSERPAAPVIATPDWMPSSEQARPGGGQESWARLDAILGQIDRVPDLSEPLDPLDWDQRGLPR